jgi:tetratricopeptide (TPR) repeat protein
MTLLSLSMIVKDEAIALPDCLQSVQGVVDELVIVDTGSQDDTKAIAQSFGAKVFDFAWCDDFAAARNYSLAQVTGDWVLVLDADETLIRESIPAILAAIQAPDTLLITLLREEVGATQSPVSLVSRLFRRHPQIQFQRAYHEWVDDTVMALQAAEPHWQVCQLPLLAIRHAGYHPDAIANRQKFQRAETILSAALQANPTDAYLASKLGGLYLEQGHPQQALALLQQGLNTDPSEPAIRYELAFHLGLTQAALGQWAAARAAYELAIAQALPPILKIGAFLNLAAIALDQNDPNLANSLLQQVIAAHPTSAIAHYNLGLTRRRLGQFSVAAESYRQAIALNPAYAEAHQNLGVVLLKLGDVAGSQAAFGQAIALYEQQNSAIAQQLIQGLQEMGLY